MDKAWYKERIYGLEVRVVEEIRTALLSSEPKRSVLRRIRALIRAESYLDDQEKQMLYLWSVSEYNTVSKKTWEGTMIRKLSLEN